MGAKAASEPWVGRPLVASRGRGAAPRRRALHRRPRPGGERPPRGRAPLAVRARAHHAARPGSRARASPAWSASSPVQTWSSCHGHFRSASTRPSRSTPPRTRRCATSASPSRSSSRATATSRRMRSSWSRSSTSRSLRCSTQSPRWTPTRACRIARSRTGTSTERSPVPTSSSAAASRARAGRAPRSSATAWSATGTRPGLAHRLGELPGPFTLHSVAAAALGLPGSKLRLITPPDSGGSFGIKATVYVYVVLHGPRVAQARRARALDRGSPRAPRRAAPRRRRASPSSRRRSPSDGELLALRYDAIEDVGAYVRAPEPATLYRMHGSLAGAYRVRDVATRNRVVLTNRCPTGLNRGFGGPQVYLALERTMAIAAARLGLDPAELRAPEPDRAPTSSRTGRRRAALYDSGDYEACLDRALELGRYASARDEQARPRAPTGGSSASASPAWSSRRSRTWATSRSPARPRSGRGSLPKSGNAEGARDASSPRSAASPFASARRRRARGTHGLRADRRGRARRRPAATSRS